MTGPPKGVFLEDVQKPEQASEAAKTRKTRQQSRPKGMPKKLLLFDFDIMEMVRSGTNTADKLMLLTGVDSLQFGQRADFLCRDPKDPQVLRLGIKGYEELAKRREAEKKKAGRQKPAVQAAKPEAVPAVFQAPVAPEQTQGPAVNKTAPAAQQKTSRQDDVDLFELLRRGSPRNGNAAAGAQIQKTLSIAQGASRTLPFEEQVQKLGGREAVKAMIEKTTQAGECELCRAQFKLSANPSENNPKYGYCFCGAAYHRDCYEHLVGSQGSCVRCGKKLQIRMDRASEDAVKAIKKLFD